MKKETAVKTKYYKINEDIIDKQEQYFTAPTILFLDDIFIPLSDTAKILYIRMMGRTCLSKKNNWCDKNGNIYIIFTIEEMKKLHDCSGYKIQKSLKELEAFGLIERRKCDTSRANKIYVKHIVSAKKKNNDDNDDKNNNNGDKTEDQEYFYDDVTLKQDTEDFYDSLPDFSEVTNNTVENLNDTVDFHENTDQKITYSYQHLSHQEFRLSNHIDISDTTFSDVDKIGYDEPHNFNCNRNCTRQYVENKSCDYTDKQFEEKLKYMQDTHCHDLENHKSNSNMDSDIFDTSTDRINQNGNQNKKSDSHSGAKNKKSQTLSNDDVSMYEHIIKDNISYTDNMQILPQDEKEWYDAMYECIRDIVCVPRNTVRVSKTDYPYQLVKSQFLKLRQSNLKYAIYCIKKHAGKIRNIKSYIITTLYNSFSANVHYQNHYQNMVDDGCFA